MIAAAGREAVEAITDPEIAILGGPGVELEPVVDALASAPQLSSARLRRVADPHSLVSAARPTVVVAVLSPRIGEVFEDLIGLCFAGVPWIAVAPDACLETARYLGRAAGALAVVTESTIHRDLSPAVAAAVGGEPPSVHPPLSPAFIAMLTHVLGMSSVIEIAGPDGQGWELTIQDGAPWSCRATDGRRGVAAATEALAFPSQQVRVATVREPGPRNIFLSLSELLHRSSVASSPHRYCEPNGPPAHVGSALESWSSPASHENIKMPNHLDLSQLNSIEGFIGACLVDSESGMLLGQEGGGGQLNLELAAAGNSEVVRAKRKTMNSLALKDSIEDILISLGKQYHIIRPLKQRNTLFLYIALNRSQANLAMARLRLREFEDQLTV